MSRRETFDRYMYILFWTVKNRRPEAREMSQQLGVDTVHIEDQSKFRTISIWRLTTTCISNSKMSQSKSICTHMCAHICIHTPTPHTLKKALKNYIVLSWVMVAHAFNPSTLEAKREDLSFLNWGRREEASNWQLLLVLWSFWFSPSIWLWVLLIKTN